MAKKRIRKRQMREVKTKPEFDQQLVDLARVTRVMKGGKRLSFRACVVIGNRKGRVGTGIASGSDVQIAIEKAVHKANKKIITAPMINNTIPYKVIAKYGAARVLLRPARRGHGIVAGGATRMVLSLAGVKNVTAKRLGSKNKINNVKATMKALQLLKIKTRFKDPDSRTKLTTGQAKMIN